MTTTASPQSVPKRPHVVVVGGGFGGLAAVRGLRHADVDVTLVDRRNHHLFQPLLYQVATAALSPGDIAYPIRSILRSQDNVTTILGEVRKVDVERRTLDLDHGELTYDWLVLATGANHAYFGHDEWRVHAPGLKSIEDALEMRRRILLAYESAEREADEEARAAWMTFVVIGAGPTGVELAGALSEIGRHAVAHDFRSIDPRKVRVVLVEGSDRVLPPYDPGLSEKAKRQLEGLGVEVRTGLLAEDIDDEGVTLANGERIAARTVLWAAGVAASPLGEQLGVETDKVGRPEVAADLSLPGHPEVFVVGDLALARSKGKEVPGVAPAASQGGKHAARMIRRRLEGKDTEAFRYVDKGQLATVGRARAVADLGWAKVSGYPAWLLWWVVHIFFLIDFRSRMLVMFGWIWEYLTYQRGARLITGGTEPDGATDRPLPDPENARETEVDRLTSPGARSDPSRLV